MGLRTSSWSGSGQAPHSDVWTDTHSRDDGKEWPGAKDLALSGSPSTGQAVGACSSFLCYRVPYS
jgi:hypothetical protein